MTTHLARYFQKRRLELGLSVAQLARMVGYANVSKGYRKIDAFERTGECHTILFGKLMETLQVDERTQSRLAYEDYKDWLATPANPPAPYMLRSPIRGCLGVPEELETIKEIEQYAADYARRGGWNVCLVLNKRIRMVFAPDGSLKEIVEALPGGE